MPKRIINLGQALNIPIDGYATDWRSALESVGLIHQLPNGHSLVIQQIQRVQDALTDFEQTEGSYARTHNDNRRPSNLPVIAWAALMIALLFMIVLPQVLIDLLGPGVVPVGIAGAVGVAIYTIIDHKKRKEAGPLFDARARLEDHTRALLDLDFVVALNDQCIESTPSLNGLCWLVEALESSDPECDLLKKLRTEVNRIQQRLDMMRLKPDWSTNPEISVDLSAWQEKVNQM